MLFGDDRSELEEVGDGAQCIKFVLRGVTVVEEGKDFSVGRIDV